ncbi:MAG: response regulator transcription factor [Bacteroidetes bacterium]|nr:response regulator transcription factor [Bacteroidota bacterium]
MDTDEIFLDALKNIFENADFKVVTCNNGKEAIEISKIFQPHLVLLELVLQGMDGIEVCHDIKSIPSLKKTFIAFYTSRSEDYSQIAAFSVGADDYIIKPVRPNVLMMRVKAILKRHRSNDFNKSVEAGAIKLNRERYLVVKGNEEIILPRKAFELLALMLATPKKVFTREEIYQEIWRGEYGRNNRTIDVHIQKLRDKIGEQFIKTVRGIGYCFETK